MIITREEDGLTRFDQIDELDDNKEYQVINGEYVEGVRIDYTKFLQDMDK